MFSRVVCRPLTSVWMMTKYSASSKHFYINHNITCNTCVVCTPGFAVAQRFYSHKTEAMTVEFDYVKRATSDSNVLVVDVREPDELKQHGTIPNSINIPLGNVTTALGQLPDQEFSKNYQRPKPKKNSEIIFFCMIGKRSATAQDNAIKLGYKNTKNYLGSFTDWAEKNKAA